jgi:hypothetical protein
MGTPSKREQDAVSFFYLCMYVYQWNKCLECTAIVGDVISAESVQDSYGIREMMYRGCETGAAEILLGLREGVCAVQRGCAVQ